MRDALYIPAYSDGLMNMLENDDDDIRKKYQTDFNKKKSVVLSDNNCIEPVNWCISSEESPNFVEPLLKL